MNRKSKYLFFSHFYKNKIKMRTRVKKSNKVVYTVNGKDWILLHEKLRLHYLVLRKIDLVSQIHVTLLRVAKEKTCTFFCYLANWLKTFSRHYSREFKTKYVREESIFSKFQYHFSSYSNVKSNFERDFVHNAIFRKNCKISGITIFFKVVFLKISESQKYRFVCE